MSAFASIRVLRAARMAPIARTFVAARPVRAFHVSPIARSESTEAKPDPEIDALREKIANHDGAREAIMKLGELMTSKGIDTTKPPTTPQLLKLGMDPEIREAGKNLMAQLQAAGVEMNPAVASQLFSKVVKDE